MPSPTLTPEQNAAVLRMQNLHGDEAAYALLQRYEAKAKLAEAKPPVAPTAPPAPSFKEVLTTEPEPEAPAPFRTYIGYKGVKGLEPQPPVVPMAYTPLTEVWKQEGQTQKELSRWYQDATGASAEDADVMAADDIIAKRKARDISGAAVPFQSRKDLREVGGFSALLEALKPQVHMTPEQAQEKKATDESMHTLRTDLYLKVAKQVKADNAYRDEQGMPPLTSDEADKRRLLYLELAVEPARAEYLKQARAEYTQRTGAPFSEEEAQAMGRQDFLQYVGAVAPTLLKKEMAGTPQTKAALGAAASDTARLFLTKKDESGAISESVLGTGLRDLNALWRPVFNPVREALTYEVDEQGQVADPTDFAYQAEKRLPKGMKESGLSAAPLTMGGSLTPRPFQARKVTGENASTGDYWLDVALDVQKGKWLGEDFSELPTYQKQWDEAGMHNAPLWIGMGAELALPATPLGLVGSPLKAAKVFVGTKLAARTARKSMEGLEDVADLSKLADEASILKTTATHITAEAVEPLVLAEALAARTGEVADELYAVTHSTTARALVAEATDEAGNVSRAVLREKVAAYIARMDEAAAAGKLAPEVQRAWALAKEVTQRFRAPFKGGEGAEAAAAALEDVATRSPTATTNDLLSASFVRAAVQQMEEAGAVVNKKLSVPDFLAEYAGLARDPGMFAETVKAVVKDTVTEGLRNKLPADLMFITPTVVAKRSAFDAVSAYVLKDVREVMAGTMKDGAWLAKDGQRVADRLLSALGPGRADSEMWQGIVGALEEGQGISHTDYLTVFNEVLGREAIRSGEGLGLQFTGGAATRALEVPVTQLPLRGLRGGDVTQAMGSGITGALARKLFPPLEETAKTPLVVRNWLTSLRGAVANVPVVFRTEVAAAQKELGRVAGFQKVLDDTWAASNLTAREVWTSTVNVYFGLGHGVSPTQLDALLARTVGESFPTPEGLQAVIDAVRSTHTNLQGVGLRSPVPGFNKPDLFAALTAAALEARTNATVAAGYTRLLGENPHLVLPLKKALDSSTNKANLRGMLELHFEDAHPSVKAVNPHDIYELGRDADRKATVLTNLHEKVRGARERLAALPKLRPGMSKKGATSGVPLSPVEEAQTYAQRFGMPTAPTPTAAASSPDGWFVSVAKMEAYLKANPNTKLEALLAPVRAAREKMEAALLSLPLGVKRAAALRAKDKSYALVAKGVPKEEAELRALYVEKEALAATHAPDLHAQYWGDVQDLAEGLRALDEKLSVGARTPTSARTAVEAEILALVEQVPEATRASQEATDALKAARAWKPPVVANPYAAAIDELVALAARADKRGRGTAVSRLLEDKLLGGGQGVSAIPVRGLGDVREILKGMGIKDPKEVAGIQALIHEFLYNPLKEAIDGQVGGWGLLSGQNVDQALLALRPYLTDVPDTELVSLFGREAAHELGKLKNTADVGQLSEALEKLRIKDPGTKSYVSALVWDVILPAVRRSRTGGVLSGFPLPNLVYHGVNITTAPLIIALTTDIPTALKAMATGVERLADWVAMKAGRSADAVVMVDSGGRQWTRAMLEDSMHRSNVGFSQISFEFSDTLLRDMEREMRLTPQVEKMGGFRKLWEEMRPAGKNYVARFAEFSDAQWRKNVYVTALREGLTEEQAADIARRSLLDYTKIGEGERKLAARFLLVYAFRRRMMTDTLTAILRNPDDLRRIVLLGVRQQQIADTWASGDDDTMTKLWGRFGGTYDGVPTGVFGPGNPPMESFRDVAQVLGWGFSGFDFADAKSEMADQVGEPILNAILDTKASLQAKDGPMVPAQQVAALMETGLWPAFVEFYHVEPVYGADRYAGTPTYEGVQFRFSDREGTNAYIWTMVTLMEAGLQRNVNDYAKLALASGMDVQGMEPKRFGPGDINVGARAVGIERPLPLPGELVARERQVRRQLAELRSLAAGK